MCDFVTPQGVSCDLLMLNICLDHENYIDYIWCMDKRRWWYGGAISSQLLVILVILVAFRMAPSMESNLLNSDLISCCLALKVCDFSPWWTTVDHCGPGNLAELGPWELKQWTKVTWWLLHHSPLSALWQVWFAEVRGSTDANCLKVTWTPPFHTVLIHFGIFQSVDFTWLDWYLNCTVMLLFK